MATDPAMSKYTNIYENLMIVLKRVMAACVTRPASHIQDFPAVIVISSPY